MKRIPVSLCCWRFLIALLSSLFLLAMACDVISESDFQTEYNPLPPPSPDNPEDPGTSIRNLLLEDYTGIRCANCPLAAAEALALKGIYGHRLVVIAVHAGSFARPFQGHDFNTPAGTEYNKFFKITSYPEGVLSRTPYKGKISSSYDNWAGALDLLLPKVAPATLDLSIFYSEGSREYHLEVGIKRTAAQVQPQYNLLLWLVEDHILSPQTMTDGRWSYDYYQRHVFRGTLSSTWGDPLVPPAVGERVAMKRGPYTLLPEYEQANCSVVAILCDPTTQEVVQVVESRFSNP